MTIAAIQRTAGEICQLANRKYHLRERVTNAVLWALCIVVLAWLASETL